MIERIAGLLPTIVLAAAGAAGVVAGGRALFVTVTVAALLVLIDLQALLLRARKPAMLPAAAVLALGIPILPDRGGWEAAPMVVLAGFVVAIVLVIATERRSGAVTAMAATMLAGLLPGLGGGALMVLVGYGDAAPVLLVGFVAAAELGRAAAGWYAGGAGQASDGPGRDPRAARGAFVPASHAALGAGAAVLVAGLASHFLVDHGLTGEALTLMAAVAALGVLGAATLRQALIGDRRGLVGTALRAAGAVAISAPPALLVVGTLG